ncbi:MAG TPA: ABC transporter substrate-binding protein [Bacteroidales bacterium]|nr:ABC transporter substrate-binding protein [Bacteroidales bacterium]
MKKISFILFTVLLFAGCTQKEKQNQNEKKENLQELSYAVGFSITNHDEYKEITLYNPWENGEIFANYYLVKDENTEVPADGLKVKIPLENIATTAVTQLEFLSLLSEIESINGICNPNLVYNADVQNRFSKGEISDLGDSFSINVERTILLRPQALMMSGHNQIDANVERIKQAGVPVIYNNEWMETSLLGRAEWIKLVAVFFDKSEMADSIFSEIEKNYNSMKEKAVHVINKPKIMAGSNFRGTWYVPAGRNFMSQLFRDAGADYFYANDTTSGSLPLNVELVLKNFSDTEFWLNCNFSTKNELIKADSKHALFRAVKEDKVYNFNKRLLPSSANDFWESAVARPDLLLADVIAILHPEILPEHELVYAAKLE